MSNGGRRIPIPLVNRSDRGILGLERPGLIISTKKESKSEKPEGKTRPEPPSEISRDTATRDMSSEETEDTEEDSDTDESSNKSEEDNGADDTKPSENSNRTSEVAVENNLSQSNVEIRDSMRQSATESNTDNSNADTSSVNLERDPGKSDSDDNTSSGSLANPDFV